MNEKSIDEAVRLVLAQMEKEEPAQNAHKHVCKCHADKLTLEKANRLIESVMAEAKRIGVAAVVAVSDPSARPISVQCMEQAFIASFDIALNKAYTAASLKTSTKELGELAVPGGELYGIQHTGGGRIVIFGGGVLLENAGKIAGALGVSGGTAKEDTYLADYGKRIFEEVAACQ